MKNIQVIDGADNTAYDVFQLFDEEFKKIFPAEGQDIQFAEDLTDEVHEILEDVWKRRIDKKQIKGIHGTLFYQLEGKKKFYPTLREEDLTKAKGRQVAISRPAQGTLINISPT